MLTTFDLDEYVYAALRAGASGFLLKDDHPDELLHAVRLVHRGRSDARAAVTRRLIERVRRPPRARAARRRRSPGLTERELEVARARGRGLSNAEIGERALPQRGHREDTHRRVLGKLGVRDRVQIVVAAYESGLVQPGAKG